jgi:uncharacterized membrane protein YphA (DoxX/SURF4 family)
MVPQLIWKKIFYIFARYVLGGVFVFASLNKIAFPEKFFVGIEQYGILPEIFIKPVGLFLPFLELFFGLFLLSGFFIRYSALILSCLLIVFILAISYGKLIGNIDSCGCFNFNLEKSGPSFLILISRNLFLLSAGIYIYLINKKLKPFNA